MRRRTLRSALLSAALMIASLPVNAADVRASILSMASGERAVRVEATISQPPETVWRLFATEEGLRCWAAPVVRLELRIGGSLRSNYNKAASIGDAGTISLGILNYLDNEFITYKVTLNDEFPAELRSEDRNLQEIIQLTALPGGGTRIVSSMVGWGTGPEWEKAMAFFEKGNEWSYRELARCAERSGQQAK